MRDEWFFDMCGIAGYMGFDSVPERDRVAATLDLMRNRGPDHRDFRELAAAGWRGVLLHSRLSIVDLDPRSNQPFERDGCVLVFNGEIYNHVELRAELQRRGVELRTTSDTEVLLCWYLLRGTDCVRDFEGMWSFAIFDGRTGTLFLSRDRFAEKPLYYFEYDGGLYFGSEVKFIRSLAGVRLNVARAQVRRYLVNGYKALYKTEDTFFEGVRELPPAANLVAGPGGVRRVTRYWTPRRALRAMRRAEAVDLFRERLLESVRLRLRADVPIAFCLSGGVDSTAIASIAAKRFGYEVATFSIIDSDERYNERDNIMATLADLNCRYAIIETSPVGFRERLRDLVAYHDAPLYAISYYVHSFLSEAIAREGYRVACSGTGADELVTGYYDHFNLYLYAMRESPDYPRYLEEWRNGPGRFVRNPYLSNPELYFGNPQFRDHIYLNSRRFAGLLRAPFDEPFIEERYCDELLQNRMMNEMFHEGTRAILHEDDLNSMRYSVENRSPYLDSRLFEFAYSIPTEYLVQGGLGKYILREAVKGIVNEQVRLDPRKRGFNASLTSLVNFQDEETLSWLFSDSPIFELIDRDKLRAHVPAGPMPDDWNKFWFYFINARMFMDLNG